MTEYFGVQVHHFSGWDYMPLDQYKTNEMFIFLNFTINPFCNKCLHS